MPDENRLATLGHLMAADVDASPYLADVAASLDHPAVPVRQLAAAVLGKIGAPAAVAVRPLCRCLTAPEDDLRAVASFALARIGPAAVPALRLMLQFSDPRTVASAVGALSQIGPAARESLADLEALAPRASLAVQMACAAAVARISGDASRGLPLLLRTLDHPDPSVRKQSLERITELGPAAHAAIPRILECAADPAPEVRAAGALTLGRIRAPASDAVPPMTRLLDDASPEVRMNAMIVLASYGDAASAALPALRRWTGDGDAKTSAAASAAIERISGKAQTKDEPSH
jgi:HEAT repeat protein